MAKPSSIQIKNNQAAINRLAIVKGFFVEISNPAKKDCEIPIYNTGSIFTIISIQFSSKLMKSSQYFGIFESGPTKTIEILHSEFPFKPLYLSYL